MADDRIYLVHKPTGQRHIFYKHYAVGGGDIKDPDALTIWMRDCLHDQGVSLDGDPQFELVTESDLPSHPKACPPI